MSDISAFGVNHGYEIEKGFSSSLSTATNTAKRSAAMRAYKGAVPAAGPKSGVAGRLAEKKKKLGVLVAPYKGSNPKG